MFPASPDSIPLVPLVGPPVGVVDVSPPVVVVGVAVVTPLFGMGVTLVGAVVTLEEDDPTACPPVGGGLVGVEEA